MDKLQITGGMPLEGEVRISGAKNATLPILAGALLADGPVTIGNVPHLQDVTTMIELLGRMGVTVTIDERMRIEVDASTHQASASRPTSWSRPCAPRFWCSGPLVARFGQRRRVAARRLRHRRAPGEHPRRRPAGHGRGHPHRGRLHPRARRAAARRAPGARHRHRHRHREPDDGGDARRRRDRASRTPRASPRWWIWRTS